MTLQQFSLMAPVGDSTGRKAACNREELPDRYRPFLNTSFIGPALKMKVGAVNYTYHRFGPLVQKNATGRSKRGRTEKCVRNKQLPTLIVEAESNVNWYNDSRHVLMEILSPL